MENPGYSKEKVPEQQYPTPTIPRAGVAAGSSDYVQVHPNTYYNGAPTTYPYNLNGHIHPPNYTVEPSGPSYNDPGQRQCHSCHCFYGSTTTTNDGGVPYEPIQQNDWRRRIPIMPMWLAVTCLIINCILPGFGTLISSCSVCCCSQSTLAGHSKCRSHCSTFWVGWAQMFSIVFFLIGYVWAIAWSVSSIKLSRNYYGKDIRHLQATNEQIPPPHHSI